MDSVDKMCPSTMFPLKKRSWQYPDLCPVAFTQVTLTQVEWECEWGSVGPSAILTRARRVSVVDEQGSGHRHLLVYFRVASPVMLQVGREEAEDITSDGQNGEAIK